MSKTNLELLTKSLILLLCHVTLLSGYRDITETQIRTKISDWLTECLTYSAGKVLEMLVNASKKLGNIVIAIAVSYFTVNLLSSEWEFDHGNLFGIYINTYYCQFTLAHPSPSKTHCVRGFWDVSINGATFNWRKPNSARIQKHWITLKLKQTKHNVVPKDWLNKTTLLGDLLNSYASGLGWMEWDGIRVLIINTFFDSLWIDQNIF